MQASNRKLWMLGSEWKEHIIFLLVALILSLAFMHPVLAPEVGLDPSWQIALSKAHVEHLRWGKDIIFTYGPLSYLFFGSFVESSYWEMQLARYLLNFAWLFLSLEFSFKLDRPFSKGIALFTFIFIPSVIGNISYYAEAKFIVIALVMILNTSMLLTKETGGGKSNFAYYLYGLTSALFFFVKFNFGLLTVIGLLTSTLTRVFLALKSGESKV